MRNILIFAFFGIASLATSAQSVCFSYDAAGNRTRHSTLCNQFLTTQGDGLSMEDESTFASTNKFSPSATDDAKENLLYPNPTSGKFTIYLSGSYAVQVYVRDLHGKLEHVLQEQKDNLLSVDISHLPSGYYLAQVIREDLSVQQWKVIKQ